MIRSGAIGALNNGLVHYSYYKWIDGKFPYDKFSEKRFGPKDGARSKLAVGFTKWAIEWPTMGVYKVGRKERKDRRTGVSSYTDTYLAPSLKNFGS